jgi:hypothetical protein
MFITRKKLEEIKSATRWEYESQLNREREIRDMHDEIWQLRRRLDMLEGKTNPVNEVVYTKG